MAPSVWRWESGGGYIAEQSGFGGGGSLREDVQSTHGRYSLQQGLYGRALTCSGSRSPVPAAKKSRLEDVVSHLGRLL
jgi:hypothetical protein